MSVWPINTLLILMNLKPLRVALLTSVYDLCRHKGSANTQLQVAMRTTMSLSGAAFHRTSLQHVRTMTTAVLTTTICGTSLVSQIGVPPAQILPMVAGAILACTASLVLHQMG